MTVGWMEKVKKKKKKRNQQIKQTNTCRKDKKKKKKWVEIRKEDDSLSSIPFLLI